MRERYSARLVGRHNEFCKIADLVPALRSPGRSALVAPTTTLGIPPMPGMRQGATIVVPNRKEQM